MEHVITILDAYTTTQGSISWEGLEGLGRVVAYDRTSPSDVVARCIDSDIVLTNKVVMDSSIMSQLPKLAYIGVLATGYNVVDTAYAAAHGIVVSNVPAYSSASVAQMVIAHLLNVTNNIAHYADECRRGRWASSPDFCFLDTQTRELEGQAMGIVGMGNIGSRVATAANALGMRVLAVTSKRPSELPSYVTPVSPDTLFETADVISLHCPLTSSTRHMVNATTLAMVRPGAIIINTGRGDLVDEEAVAQALTAGTLSAYCADVLSAEPPAPDNPLVRHPQAFLTPHIAWASLEARQRLVAVATENVRAFIEGRPLNNVAL